MDNTKEFISKFKELEQVVREEMEVSTSSPILVLDESSLEFDRNRLAICRQTRNFIQHNENNSFVVPTYEMIKFLDDLIKLVKSMKGTVKDKKKTKSKSPFALETDNLEFLSVLLTANEVVFVLNKKDEVLGVVTKTEIVNAISNGKSVKTTKAKSIYVPLAKTCGIGIVEESTPLSSVACDYNLVTKNGKLTGTYMKKV